MEPLRDFDAARQLLLACALAPANGETDWAVSRIAPRVENWTDFLAAARFNQLRPQAARCLRAETGVPDAVRLDLAASAAVVSGRSLLMTAELIRILACLADAGIEAMPFKGPAFAVLFEDGPKSREMSDLDVFIRADDIARCVSILSPLGYEGSLQPAAIASGWLPRATNELGLVRRQGGILLELHWRLAPRWYPVPLEASEVLASCHACDLFGSTIRWPDAETLLLIHVSDAMKSGGAGMRWLGDVANILRARSVDWSRTAAMAGRNHGLNNLRVALAALEELSGEAAALTGNPDLGVPLPPEARALAREACVDARLTWAVGAIRERLRADGLLRGAAAHFGWALRMADRPAGVAAAILRHLSGPALADLALLPPEGLADAPLRLRALRRRLVSRMHALP